MDKKKWIRFAALAIVVLFSGVMYVITTGENTSKAVTTVDNQVSEDKERSNLEVDERSDLEDEEQGDSPSADTVNTKKTQKEALQGVGVESQIKVHVCGAIKIPGVYAISSEARVVDVIALAGGVTAEAAADYINQASVLKDGQRIYVPNLEEVTVLPEEALRELITEEIGDGQAKGNSTEKLDLNLASKEELMTLPGIGEAKAESILLYRTESGGFQTIEDIQKIPGIKAAVFGRIKEFITVKVKP